MSSKLAAWDAAGWSLGIALSGAAVIRMTRPERSTVDVAVTAATPWLLAPSWPLLAVALVTRRRRLATLAAALATYHATCSRPRSRPGPCPGSGVGGPQLRVAFANVWWHNRDVRGVLAELAAGDHDIVALAEVGTHHVGAIDELLPLAEYPWRWLEPERFGSKGLALVSRVPLERMETWSNQGHPHLGATVLSPGARPFHLLVVHTWGPIGGPKIRLWRAQLAELAERAQRAAPSAGALPLLMVGDFNATLQHRSFDKLVGPGWSDAATFCFGGWRATWPANRRWRPPLFRIDHIVSGPGISVRSGRAGRAHSSDHRPVSAVLVLPSSTSAHPGDPLSTEPQRPGASSDGARSGKPMAPVSGAFQVFALKAARTGR